MSNLSDLLLLSDICEQYFALKPEVARRWHALGKLPINAFRLGNASRGPLYVHKDDLAALIDQRRAESAKQFQQLRSVK